jgi:hypothetical protein
MVRKAELQTLMAVITHITPNLKPEAVGTVAHCKTAFAWAP